MSRRYGYPARTATTPAHDDALGVKLNAVAAEAIAVAEAAEACTPTIDDLYIWDEDASEWTDAITVTLGGDNKPQDGQEMGWLVQLVGTCLDDCTFDWSSTWTTTAGASNGTRPLLKFPTPQGPCAVIRMIYYDTTTSKNPGYQRGHIDVEVEVDCGDGPVTYGPVILTVASGS